MMSPEIFKFFSSYIEKEIGVKYSETNSYQLEGRLLDIAKYTGAASIEELYQGAQRAMRPELKQLLLDVATNNETSFFRDKALFELVEKMIIPEMVKKKPKLSIWSAASSYGQEAMSISMIASELKQSGIPITASILATDISEKVLKRARTGVYSQLEVQRGLPVKLLAKYFIQNGENWQVRPEILSTVQFETQNLLGDFLRKGPFDLIFCRNILIYQSVENKIQVIKKLHSVLQEGGCLFLGAGESLMGLSNEFQLCNSNGIVYYKKKERCAISA